MGLNIALLPSPTYTILIRIPPHHQKALLYGAIVSGKKLIPQNWKATNRPDMEDWINDLLYLAAFGNVYFKNQEQHAQFLRRGQNFLELYAECPERPAGVFFFLLFSV